MIRKNGFFILVSLSALIGCTASASNTNPAASNPVEITEWTVPWQDTRPRDPFVDKRQQVWFVGQRGDYIAVVDPRIGKFKRFELDPGTGPHNLIVDDQGMVWYAGNRAAHIGKLDPQSGKIMKYDMPDPAARDPHTLAFDQNGDIWFTVQGGNFVGHLKISTGEIRLFQIPSSHARPYGIIVDTDNRPWIAEFGTNKLAMVDPSTLTLKEVLLPRADARPRRLATTSDGRIWYVDYAEGYLGTFDPATGKFQEWPTPAKDNSRPYSMTVDDQDRLWFVETGPQPNRLVGFDSRTRKVFSLTEIKSGGGTVRHMVFHQPTRTIWFGTDANTIGRASVP